MVGISHPASTDLILAISGGVGGARLCQGLVQILRPDELAIVVNVGDDFEHLGLSISPDLDTVMYTLADLHHRQQGWGRADESWNFMEVLKQLGGESWFQLGDRDLAVHVERTRRLAAGDTLSAITADFCARLGIAHPVLPVTDQRLRTRVMTRDCGELDFQDYFVRRRAAPALTGLRFEGAAQARLSAPLERMIASGSPSRVRGVIVCPSNPWLSVAPVRAVEPLSHWVASHRIPVVAVSPIIGGQAVKGPAAKIMRELGVGQDTLGVVRHYGPWVKGWVIDRADETLAEPIRARGHDVAVTDTLMRTPDIAASLAQTAVDLLRTLA
jgi:LPPG:FO 2-phospho-L-lactate transferase